MCKFATVEQKEHTHSRCCLYLENHTFPASQTITGMLLFGKLNFERDLVNDHCFYSNRNGKRQSKPTGTSN